MGKLELSIISCYMKKPRPDTNVELKLSFAMDIPKRNLEIILIKCH